jgi:hypothetical protein
MTTYVTKPESVEAHRFDENDREASYTWLEEHHIAYQRVTDLGASVYARCIPVARQGGGWSYLGTDGKPADGSWVVIYKGSAIVMPDDRFVDEFVAPVHAIGILWRSLNPKYSEVSHVLPA